MCSLTLDFGFVKLVEYRSMRVKFNYLTITVNLKPNVIVCGYLT